MRARWIIVSVAAVALAGCSNMHSSKATEEDEGNEVKMSINDIPAAARESLMKESGGTAITTVDKEDRKGKTVYEADAMMNGKNWEIVVDGDGKVVSKKLDEEKDEKSSKKSEKEEDEEKEKK